MAVLYLVRHARTIVDPGVPAFAWGLDPAGAEALARVRGQSHVDFEHWRAMRMPDCFALEI